MNNKLVLPKALKYKVNFEDVEQQKHVTIAKQLTSIENKKVFQIHNLIFWIKFSIKWICLIALIVILIFSIGKSYDDLHNLFMPSVIFFCIGISIELFLSMLSSPITLNNYRLLYFKAKLIHANNEENFSKKELDLLSQNMIDYQDSLQLIEPKDYTLKQFKMQVILKNFIYFDFVLALVFGRYMYYYFNFAY